MVRPNNSGVEVEVQSIRVLENHRFRSPGFSLIFVSRLRTSTVNLVKIILRYVWYKAMLGSLGSNPERTVLGGKFPPDSGKPEKTHGRRLHPARELYHRCQAENSVGTRSDLGLPRVNGHGFCISRVLSVWEVRF